MGYDCHCCGDAAYDLTCPTCEAPTCEVCFTPMTMEKEGNPLPCVECESDYWWEKWREVQKEVMAERKAMEAARRRLEFDLARRRSPEGQAERQRKRLEAVQARREQADAHICEVLSIFMGLDLP